MKGRLLRIWPVLAGLLVAGGVHCSEPCKTLQKMLQSRLCERLPEHQRPLCKASLQQYDGLSDDVCQARLRALEQGTQK